MSPPPHTAASPWPWTTIASEKPGKFRPWNATSPTACAARPTCCCCPSPASTSSAPPTSPARWGRSNTTPTPAPSPAAPACDRRVIRATKSTTPTAPWCEAAIARCAPSILRVADNLINCNHHFQRPGAPVGRAGERPATYAREGGAALLSHRLPDGRRPSGVSPSVSAGAALHPRQVDGLPSRTRHRHGRRACAICKPASSRCPSVNTRAEARPLARRVAEHPGWRRHGPQLLGDILPMVLARLGVGEVQSTASGEEDLHRSRVDGPRTPYVPKGSNP